MTLKEILHLIIDKLATQFHTEAEILEIHVAIENLPNPAKGGRLPAALDVD